MDKEVLIKVGYDVSVDTQNAEDALKKLQKQLADLEELKISSDGKDLDVLNAKIRAIKDQIDVVNQAYIAPQEELTESLDKATEKAKELIEAGKENTEEFQNLKVEIGEIVSEQEDLNQAVQNLDSEKFADLSNKFSEIEEKAEVFSTIKEDIANATIELDKMVDAGEDSGIEFEELQTKVEDLNQKLVDVGGAASQFDPSKFEELNEFSGESIGLFQKVKNSIVEFGDKGKTTLSTLKDQFKALSENTKLQTIATKAGTIALKTMGVALKALGIGLITTAIALLINNFHYLKDAVLRLFPFLEALGKAFQKLSEIFTDFIGATSDATRAYDDNVKAIGKQNEALEAQIAVLEALGKKEEEVYKLKREITLNNIKLLREELALNREIDDEDHKRINALFNELAVTDAKELKRIADVAKKANDTAEKASDKASKLRDKDLKELKKFRKEADAVIYGEGKYSKDTELYDLKVKYKEQLDLAKKLGTDSTNITQAFKVEERAINKKYDDEYLSYINGVSDSVLTAYDKLYIDLGIQAKEARKNATSVQKQAIDDQLMIERLHIDDLKSLAIEKQKTLIDLAKVEGDNVINDGDSPDEILSKTLAVNEARKQAEDILFQEQLLAKQTNNEKLLAEEQRLQDEIKKLSTNPDVNAVEIDALQARLNGIKSTQEQFYLDSEQAKIDHENTIKAIDKDSADAKIEIEKLKVEAQLEMFDAVSGGIDAMGSIIGENAVASKAMAIASSTIDTYSAIAGTLKAFSGIPIPGYAIAQSVATGIVGIANVKKILSVKVPDVKGKKSSSPNVSAPNINSTILSQAKSGNNNVVDAVNESTEKKNNNPQRTYLVYSDLKTQSEKDAFVEQVSTF